MNALAESISEENMTELTVAKRKKSLPAVRRRTETVDGMALVENLLLQSSCKCSQCEAS